MAIGSISKSDFLQPNSTIRGISGRPIGRTGMVCRHRRHLLGVIIFDQMDIMGRDETRTFRTFEIDLMMVNQERAKARLFETVSKLERPVRKSFRKAIINLQPERRSERGVT